MKTVYCDVESGTYFLLPPARIDATNWDDADWDAWDSGMNDADRGAYSEQYINHQIEGTADQMPSPREYCRGYVGDG